MIYIVTPQNRRLFHEPLRQMHRQRKALFVDQMKWPLETWADLEIDQFDNERALYLIELCEATGEVVQSARLLPTLEPHLLGDVFNHLCSAGAPRGQAIVEASRFCPAPSVPKGEPRRRLLFRMIGAILETGLLFGYAKVSFVANAALAPLAMKAGWDAAPLGPPLRRGRERVQAIAADITSAGLARVRALHAIEGPLTRFAEPAFARAA